MEEEWKKIDGLGRYEVSNIGRVKSIDGKVRRGNGVCEKDWLYKGKILKPYISPWGYKCVDLHIDGEGVRYTVHKLVAIKFIPNPNNRKIVNHKDGNKTNNRIDNLEWVTKSEDSLHALRTGLTNRLNVPKGEKHHNAILTLDKVIEIRKLKPTHTQQELAILYGVHESTIADIIHKRTWNYEKISTNSRT